MNVNGNEGLLAVSDAHALSVACACPAMRAAGCDLFPRIACGRLSRGELAAGGRGDDRARSTNVGRGEHMASSVRDGGLQGAHRCPAQPARRSSRIAMVPGGPPAANAACGQAGPLAAGRCGSDRDTCREVPGFALARYSVLGGFAHRDDFRCEVNRAAPRYVMGTEPPCIADVVVNRERTLATPRPPRSACASLPAPARGVLNVDDFLWLDDPAQPPRARDRARPL
jgi:hypothetical protein